jgi:uncharacterized membrane protein HdeD (DUF308 family)
MIDKNEMKRERAQAVAAGVRAGVSRKLGSIWWAFLLRGIFATALGIFALFWPTMSLSALAFAVGLYCVADGAAGLVGALRYPELREYFVQALVVIGIGAVLIFWPGATLRILLLFLGVAALFAGIGQFLTARRIPADDPERGVVMTGAGILAGQRRCGNLMGDRHRSDTDRRFVDLPGVAFQTPGGACRDEDVTIASSSICH